MLFRNILLSSYLKYTKPTNNEETKDFRTKVLNGQSSKKQNALAYKPYTFMLQQ